MHLRYGLRFALGPQAAGDLIETGFREAAGGTQQNSIDRFFDCELSPGTQAREVRMFLGSTIWPLVDSRVLSMVRLQ